MPNGSHGESQFILSFFLDFISSLLKQKKFSLFKCHMKYHYRQNYFHPICPTMKTINVHARCQLTVLGIPD